LYIYSIIINSAEHAEFLSFFRPHDAKRRGEAAMHTAVVASSGSVITPTTQHEQAHTQQIEREKGQQSERGRPADIADVFISNGYKFCNYSEL